MGDKETTSSVLDISQLRTPIQISGKPVEQVLSSIHYGSPELRCLLMDECDLIFECKVCRALFRDLPNFISHKRAYCTKSSMENGHVTIASLPEEKVVVIQPQAPEETERKGLSSTRQTRQQPKAPRPNLEDTIRRIQSGELGRSHAYQVYTEAAEKLQKQKEGMKVATIRTTTIPTNKNAVFIDVNMASVNIHERQQAGVASYDQNRNDTSVTVIKRKTGDRQENARNVRKSIKQEKHSSEPQKLLMEQLKEIQQKRVRSAPQNRDSQKESASLVTNENLLKASANANTIRVPKKVSESPAVKGALSDNAQTALGNKGKTVVNLTNTEELTNSLVKRRTGGKIQPKTDSKNQLHTINAVIAVKTRKRFVEQSLICSKCSAVFATRKSLSFHNKIHHSTKRTFYPCPYCQSVFYYFYGITRHLFKNHGKTLEEVNSMRKQLRERSFTKPLCTPLMKSEIRGVVSGSTRSTRTLARNALANVMSGTDVIKDNISVLRDRQVPKRCSGGHEIISSESSSKIADPKSSQLGSLQDEHRYDPQSSGTANDKSENVGESRSVRLKNKQKQTESSRKSNSLGNQVYSPPRRSTTAFNQTTVSTMPRFQENTSHTCPKCRRSFRRKISCMNHIKVCKAVNHKSLKKLRPQNTGHKGKHGALESMTSRNNKDDAGVKRIVPTISSDSVVKAEITGSSSKITSYVKDSPRKSDDTENKVQSRISDILRPTNSKNAQVSLKERSSLTRRSSSMDRVIKHNEPRNRSHDRNSTGRDQRDSSVESTQSNVEGKSPRNRRNVLSRYATPTQAAKSPAKFDILVKTNLKSDDDSKLIENEVISHVNDSEKKSELSNSVLSCDEDKKLRVCSGESGLKLDSESALVPEKQMLSLSPALDIDKTSLCAVNKDKQLEIQLSHDMNTTLAINSEMSRATTLLQILESPRVINTSPEKLQCSPIKSDSLPKNSPSKTDKHIISHKQIESTDRSILFQIMSAGSSLKLETSSTGTELSKNESSFLSSKSLENDTAKSDLMGAEKRSSEISLIKDPWKLQKGVADLAGLEYQSVWENSQIFKDSMMEMGANIKKQIEKPVKLLELNSDSKTDHSHEGLSKKNEECLDIKGSEISSEHLMLNSTGNVPVRNKNGKSQTVVSALSERPKRKRKVPSRNRDAEEMLSKILSHRDETVPKKKRKISPESKTAVTSKQKLRSGNVVKSTPQPSVLGANNDEVKDEFAVDEKDTPDDEVGIVNEGDISEADDDRDDNEELGKAKGRFVSNRMYVLEKCGSKRKRLKCYDQVKVFKMIDEENLKCLACGESCTQVSNLRRHVIRQHLKWSRFKCKLCKFDSYDRSECTTHLIRGHRNLAINLRNVNRYIIDLVKQGSHARSIKKNQTIKVKQSQNQDENIYARPTVKKMLRLPQRTKENSMSSPDRDLVSADREIKRLDFHLQTQRTEQVLTAAQNSEVKPIMDIPDPKPVAVVVTLSRKQLNTLTSSSKVKSFSKQPNQQRSKSGLALTTDGKDVSLLKVPRKSLPFNISTRNSPRTFDTRPYNSENEGFPIAVGNTSASSEDHLSQVGKETLGKIVPPKVNRSNELLNSDANFLTQMETIQQDIIKNVNEVENITSPEILSTDSGQASRNIFEKMKTQSSSSVCAAVTSISSGVASTTNEAKPTVNSVAGEIISPPRVFEVKIKNPQQLLEKPKLLNQTPEVSIKPVPGNIEKAKVISYILRGPQQKLTQVSDESVSADQLAKSIIQVTKLGDQLSTSSASTSCTEQILKVALPATRVAPAQIIDPVNLQRKQAYISVPAASIGKTTPIEHVKLVQQRATAAPKELQLPPSSSGMALAAALAKSGHISVTSTSSYILSHGQAGKYFIYTRPVGAKELTSVGSLIRPLAVSSPLPSSSTSSVTVISSPEVIKQTSDTQETTGEEALLPETFVVHKHYI